MLVRELRDADRPDPAGGDGPDGPVDPFPVFLGRMRASMRAHPVAWRNGTLLVVSVLYLALTLGVLFNSPVIRIDRDLLQLNLRGQYPEWRRWIAYYVIFGQRGPATLAFLPYFIWVAWRTRSSRPLVMLVTAFIILNISVGIVKVAVGRLGPGQTDFAHDILVGGDIYPSGHVSNAVVLYGLIAMIAIEHRRFATWAAVFLSFTVGLGTVYLDTHWFSDVVGGWFAGAVVLLLLPIVMPFAQRWTDALTRRVSSRWRRRRGAGRVGARQATANEAPVSSPARSQSLAATSVSREARDDPTRLG